MVSPNRREFFQTLLGSAASLSLARPAGAQAPSATLATVQLGEDLFQITGDGANIVVLAQPDGLLLVNGGLAQHVSALQQRLAEQFPSRPVKVLFNTDWHAEHTGLNAPAAKAGAKIVAHENTKLWLGRKVNCKWQKRVYTPLPKEARPNDTFYTTGELTFGRERVAYGHLGQAHTDGDIYVHFTGANVLVAGDVVAVGRYPVMDYSTGGWIVGLQNATQKLIDVSTPETRVVPGDGAVQSRAHLEAQHAMLTAMRERLVDMLRKGMGPQDMIAAAPTKDFDATWGDPTLFMNNVYPGLWWHARELGRVI